ncbi:MAG: ribonuclease III domain-containing protein [Clostridia bacterium]|nr:ribonuclease III domain-containing protein [Clostridia bacterium]
MSPLVLAYVGDTVYDLYVRTMLAATTSCTAHGMHVRASRSVCAAAQAAAFRAIEGELTQEELAVFKRGRNTHSATVPKNAEVGDYRIATGLEALLGFLYLSGEDERLTGLMRIILESANRTKGDDRHEV